MSFVVPLRCFSPLRCLVGPSVDQLEIFRRYLMQELQNVVYNTFCSYLITTECRKQQHLSFLHRLI